MCIKLRTIHTYKLGFAIHSDAACTTHTRTIHHNRIETCLGWDIILLGGQCHKLHHNGRTNRYTLIHFLAIDHLLHTRGYQSLLPHCAIIGHDNHLVRYGFKLILEYNQFCCTGSQYRNHTVTSRFQCLSNRQHRRSTYTTACANHSTKILNVRCFAQWSHQVCHLFSHFQST